MRMYLTLKKEFLDFQLSQLEAEVRRIQLRRSLVFLKANFFNIFITFIFLSGIAWFVFKDPMPIVDQSWSTKKVTQVSIGKRIITDSGEIETFLKNYKGGYDHYWVE